MANIDEAVGSQAKQLFMEALKKGSAAIGDIGKLAIAVLLEEQNLKDKDKVLHGHGQVSVKKLYQFAGEEPVVHITVADADLQDFKKHLDKQDVAYALINCKNDNSHKVVYLENKSEHVKDAVTLFMAERRIKPELPMPLFLANSNKQLTVIDNVSAVDLELFREYAKKEGLVYALSSNNRIVFNESDKLKAAAVLNGVGSVLESTHGERIRKQIELRLEGRTAVNLAADQAEKELYIVSSINPSSYVKVTPDDFTYYKNNKAVSSINREEPDFTKRLHTSVEGILEPVVLTKDEFESKNKSRIITSKTYPLPVDLSQIEVKESKYTQKFRTENIVRKAQGLDLVIENALKKREAHTQAKPRTPKKEFSK